jgi:hypothetical protein
MVLYFGHSRLSGHLSDSPGRESFLKKDAGQTGMTECKICAGSQKQKKNN